MQDWNYRYMGCNEVTLELSDIKRPPASELPQFWEENRDSLMAYMATGLIGVRGVVTDVLSGGPLQATVTVVGRDHDITTDPDVGDYHRMLLPGTYDLRFEAGGYSPVTVNDVVVLPGDASHLDVAMGAVPEIVQSGPTQVIDPNGGEMLEAGVPVTVEWEGGDSLTQFQVQHSDNYDDVQVLLEDGFEGPTLDPDYTTGGNAAWSTSTSSAHSGSWSARAGAIADRQTTWLTRTVTGGEVRFWYRVSSEAGYDFFSFYINRVRLVHASGTTGTWTEAVYPLEPGDNLLKWEYTKDVSYSSGSDTAWIDDLEITTGDNTAWSDIERLTLPGVNAVTWTPLVPSSRCKVRVRPYYSRGTYYGSWDESDAVFTVVAPPPDGDFDGDGDVDLLDFGGFQSCFAGTADWPCSAFEFVVDGQINLDDYVQFAPLIQGP
jgi:hypothetical protein